MDGLFRWIRWLKWVNVAQSRPLPSWQSYAPAALGAVVSQPWHGRDGKHPRNFHGFYKAGHGKYHCAFKVS